MPATNRYECRRPPPTQATCLCRKAPSCVKKRHYLSSAPSRSARLHRPMRRFFTLLRADASRVSGSNGGGDAPAQRSCADGKRAAPASTRSAPRPPRIRGRSRYRRARRSCAGARARPCARAATVRSPSSSTFCCCRRFSLLPRIASARRTSDLSSSTPSSISVSSAILDSRRAISSDFAGQAARQLRLALAVRSHPQAQQHVQHRHRDQRDRDDQQQPQRIWTTALVSAA